LLDLSKQRIQVAVDMGMSLGYATNWDGQDASRGLILIVNAQPSRHLW
jgi:hypothetical protein